MLANKPVLELRLLSSLEAVARHGSFSSAAEELGYTQSAVSQQIAGLERVLGQRLVERQSGPGPVALTPAGDLLLGHAEAILARAAAAQADLSALAAGTAGTLRIGAYESVAAHLLPEVFVRFKRFWPQIELSLYESSLHGEMEHMVEAGELDLVLMSPPAAAGEPFEYREVIHDPFRLVAARSLASRLPEPLTEEALAELDFVAFHDCVTMERLGHRLAERGLELEVGMRVGDNRLLQRLAARGAGCAIMPLLSVDVDDPDVVLLPLDGLLPVRRTGLLWHRDRRLPPAAGVFSRIVSEVAEELAPRLGCTAV